MATAVYRIILTNGGCTYVDKEDYQQFNKYNWYRSKAGYASRHKRINGKSLSIVLHREVLQLPVLCKGGVEVDHINQNKLDNKKSNLRKCTHQQNKYNVSGQKNKTSKHKGVCWQPQRNKWVAQIRIKGKNTCLGTFETEEEAATTYNIAAKTHHGEFAWVNII